MLYYRMARVRGPALACWSVFRVETGGNTQFLATGGTINVDGFTGFQDSDFICS